MPSFCSRTSNPKTDIRATVVGERCFFAETAEPVIGDWKTTKGTGCIPPFNGTPALKASCLALLLRA